MTKANQVKTETKSEYNATAYNEDVAITDLRAKAAAMSDGQLLSELLNVDDVDASGLLFNADSTPLTKLFKDKFILAAAQELTARMLKEQLQSVKITSPTLTKDYLMTHIGTLEHEVFTCIYLNNQNQVVATEELFRGTIDGSAVYPREVVKQCLKHNASAIIFAHNHPSGIADPSHADRAITERLKKALELIDVRVLDHLVVGKGYCESFAERGWI